MRDRLKGRSRKSPFVWSLSLLTLVAGGAIGSQVLDSNSLLRAQVLLGAAAKKPDTTGPSVTVAFPNSNGAYREATWAGGISGSASDATGVAFVEVRLGTGPWVRATGTTNWSLPMTMPVDGTYALSVRATDTATVPNTSSTSLTFRVDNIRPPAPVLTNTPEDPTFDTKAQFSFGDSESGVSFECVLDGAAKACDPHGIEYRNLEAGTHTFRVMVIDAAGNQSDPAAPFTWTVLLKKSFGIQGDASGTLYPGAPPTPLNLTITNPFNFPMKVVTLDVKAAPAGACGTNNVVVHNLAAGSTPAIVVPANGRVRLSEQLNDPLWQQHWPAAWPTIAMTDNGNQDVCKNATFTLSYTGTATKS